MHNQESSLDCETQKIICEFEIQTDLLILARWQDLVIVKKKIKEKRKIVDFTVSADHKVKEEESEKRDKCQRIKEKIHYGTCMWQWDHW